MNTTDQATSTNDADAAPQFPNVVLVTVRAEVASIRDRLGVSDTITRSSDGAFTLGSRTFQPLHGSNGAITLRVTNGDKQIGDYALDPSRGLCLADFHTVVDALQ